MKFFETIKSFYYRIQYSFRKKEYVYIYNLSTLEFTEGVTSSINHLISIDLQKEKKKVESFDYFDSKDSDKVIVICFSSNSLDRIFIPIIYETFAYAKKNIDKSVFSYKYNIITKEYKSKEVNTKIEILKFKI